jgi:nitric oxide reductase NorD protein
VAEPEDVIAEAALHATRLVRDVWARRRTEDRPRLADLRRRLELFVTAIFPETPEIGIAEPPAPPSFLTRLARHHTSHLHGALALSSVDSERIRLPGTLDSLRPEHVPQRYRLLALEQAARVARGTPRSLPEVDLLLRDLYVLVESAAVDAMLVRMFPRLGAPLCQARLEAGESRPDIRRASRQELTVERLVQGLLAAPPDLPPAPLVITETPDASRRWAEEQRTLVVSLTGPYRGIAPVPLWGAMPPAMESFRATTRGDGDEVVSPPGRSRVLSRRPRTREAAEGEDDDEPGTWMVRADDLQEKAEDPAGLQRPADRDQQADPGDLADSLSELPEARLVRTPERVSEVLIGEDPIRPAPPLASAVLAGAIAYPEWDWRAAAYRPRAAIVRERVAVTGDEAWVDATMRRHAGMIRAVRRDFERLRPRRMSLRRQPDGAELDVDALVAAYADRRGGSVADDRFYIDTRPMRRDAAITLLLDASASTDGWVAGDRRVIDVEKEALFAVGEALAALGEPHAMMAFSSAGPSRVTVQVLKRFDETTGIRAVQARIAGLEPDGYTRAGTAIRHATAGIGRQAARHRLLLLLSDGRPNDVDEYEGRYGVEDTRTAVVEARLQGVHVFCLTVDREAPRYATRIFGRDYAVLSRAERLPRVLTGLVGGLIRR